MIHLNGNLLCVIDCETTGLSPRYNEILQLAVLPLDFNLEPSKRYTPLEIRMSPRKLDSVDVDALAVSKLKLAEYVNTGIAPEIATELFDEWFNRLRLPEGKRISPLAHNWLFDAAFIREWMGDNHFEHYFDSRYRDLMPTALFINDKKDFFNEQTPFPKYNLRYLYQCCGLDDGDLKWHDAMNDCVATARIYRKMIGMQIL